MGLKPVKLKGSMVEWTILVKRILGNQPRRAYLEYTTKEIGMSVQNIWSRVGRSVVRISTNMNLNEIR